MTNDEKYLKLAMREAKKAEAIDEVPVGCIIVYQDKIIARAHNERMKRQSALGHAEIIAIQKANKKLHSWLLEGATIYITLEPCPMCAGAILQSRIKKVVFGAYEPKFGAAGSLTNIFMIAGLNHHVEVIGGVLAAENSDLLKAYFAKKR